MKDIIFVDFFRSEDPEFYKKLKSFDLGLYNTHFINASSGQLPLSFQSKSGDGKMFFVYTKAPNDFASDLYKDLQTYQENPICILCSETDDSESVRSSFLSGFSDFLKVPFSISDILNYASRFSSRNFDALKDESSDQSPSELARSNLKANEDLVKGLVFSSSKITVRQALAIKDMISTKFKSYLIASSKIMLDVEDYFENNYAEITERHLIVLHQIFEDAYFLENFSFEFIQCVLDEKICLIFFSKSENQHDFISQAEKFIENVSEVFYSRTNYLQLTGMSYCFKDIGKCPDEYLCSINAIEQQFYSRSFSNTIFKYNKIKTLTEYNESEYENIIEKLSEKKGMESFYEVFEGLLDSFSRNNISAEYAKKSLLVIFNKLIYNNVSIANSAKNRIFFEHNIEKVVNNTTNAYDIIKYFAKLINDLLFKTYYHKGVSNEIIEKAESIILNNYEKQITLTSIAEELNINPNYLSELFKKHTGLNIISYITQIRIHKAKVLLSNSDKKIYEIGNEVGYPETVSFTRAFKRIQGVSPKEYRQNIGTDLGISE